MNLVSKLGHRFISEQIGKLLLSWLSFLPCGPLCLLPFYITFISHYVAGSCRSIFLTDCSFISKSVQVVSLILSEPKVAL